MFKNRKKIETAKSMINHQIQILKEQIDWHEISSSPSKYDNGTYNQCCSNLDFLLELEKMLEEK